MAKTLFMATFETVRETSGKRDQTTRLTRLVCGTDEAHAEQVVRDEYESGDSFGGRTLVRSIEITKPFGSPD